MRVWQRLALRATGDVQRDVNRGLAGFFCALRVTDVLSAAFVIPGAISATRSIPIYLLLTAIMLTFCVSMCVSSIRRSSLDAKPWGIADFAVTLVMLVAIGSLFPANVQIGSWLVWAPGYAFGTAAGVGVWAGSTKRAAGLSLVIAGVYLSEMLAWSGLDTWTIAGNALQYPFAAIVLSLIAGYMRMLARETAKAREEAVNARGELERERYRLAVHDASGVLRLLADDGTPEVMRRALKRQALAESTRLRTYMAGHSGVSEASSDGPFTLGRVVMDAIDGFEDLPLVLAIDLGGDAELGEADALVVGGALSTLLHNVRRHADASKVTIHADQDGTSWELLVRDDGVGFDPNPAGFGFGLSKQVVAAVEARGMRVNLESAPNDGTTVRILGAMAPTP